MLRQITILWCLVAFGASQGIAGNSKLTDQEDPKGSIHVLSIPEIGMAIYLNDKNTGKTTPAALLEIPVGKHVIKLVNEFYRTQEKSIEVIEGKEILVEFTMVPIYAELTVNTSPEGIISVDGKIKGTTTWKGRVAEGVRKVKVEKRGFTTREWDVHITRGKDQQIDLMMKPKTGTLEINTDPEQAMISLDGQLYGTTPKIIPDLLLGSYNLTIEKQGYTSVSMRVTIEDAKTTKINVPLIYGKEVTITSEPEGAYLIIESDTLGVTPVKLLLRFGNHEIKLVKDDEALVERVAISPTGKSLFTYTLKQSKDPFHGQMVFVKGGIFEMGDTFGIGNKEEQPVHDVNLSDFFIGKYEVTQAQWKFIMGDNPSHFKDCDKCPVERVGWDDVQVFISRLNTLTGKNYRLPTEAEWEYAARGGLLSKGTRYAGGQNINFVSWYKGNSGSKTQPVGQLQPNELGLYDMSGNVWEWVSDWLDDYTNTPKTNPQGPEKGQFKVVKGGSWFGYIGGSRVSCRGSDDPTNKRSYIGFRVAMSP